ncbi:ribitol-5-phosphate xylosyltransferase 1-like [Lycorma delicatula]|uniref:ribitol-5-phosphate xylosyltransferase 1-like n=1 Tax=Lycorma delicatula TaxID=130591 RepID=UPI003F5107CA
MNSLVQNDKCLCEMCNKYVLAYSSVTLYTIVTIIVLILVTHKKLIFSHTDGPEQNVVSNRNISVEIWGKASIAIYLWEHILQGDLFVLENGLGKTGSLSVSNLTFNFKYGPLFIQTTVPENVEYLVLVLNGRSEDKIKVGKSWLDYLPKYNKLKKVALVLLGDERCENNWILPYMSSRGGQINIVFIVYDSILIDNTEFYQWPLGVAQYRGFQNIHKESINGTVKRPYICNFLGTIYTNSSRSKLLQIVNSVSALKKCPIVGRKTWVPSETEESLSRYIKIIEDSDLTLCPVGQNAESYRIYEALSLGSVPVVEDRATPGFCDKTPFRLLKLYKPPFIFIKDWKELPNILKLELSMPQRLKKKRRTDVLNWYQNFKTEMRKIFLNVIAESFFS